MSSLLGSRLTANASVLTANGSALTATGVCAPIPRKFLTDGASFLLGKESLLTATQAAPCSKFPLAPPMQNMVLWFKADAGITMDGANQVTQWNDQGPNHWNVKNINSSGFSVQGPTFVSTVPNMPSGLPGVYYFDNAPGSAVGDLNYFANNGHANLVPLPTDAPRMIFALATRDNDYGGLMFTFRTSANDHEYGHWNNTGSQLYGLVTSGNGILLDDQNKLINVPSVWAWRWFGMFATPQVLEEIDQVNKTYTFSGTGHVRNGLDFDDGIDGFSVGNVYSNGSSRGFSGWITEILVYSGTDPAIYAAVNAYLKGRKLGQ